MKNLTLAVVIGGALKASFGSAVDGAQRKIQGLGAAWKDASARQARMERAMAGKDAAAARMQGLKAGALGATGALYALGRMVTATAEVMQSQGELASLGVDVAGVEAITRAGREFSATWAGTTVPEFLRASYDVKSGIASLGDAAVGEFTRMAALTAAATKGTTGEMTNLFAKGFGIYRGEFDAFGARVVAGWQGLSAEERDIEFGKYFSAGISSAVQAFRTTGPEMSAALSNLGASATTAGASFAEQLAVLGELQRTMSGSEAATKYQAFLANASKAADSLGLDVIDAQTGMLLSVPEILDQISDAYGGVIDQAAKDELRKAFGDKEGSEFVDLLLTQRESLRRGAADIEKALGGGMAKTEAMAKAAQSGQAFTLLGQQLGLLSQTLGQSLYPAVATVTEGLGGLVGAVARVSERAPWLVQVVAGAVAGFALLTGGLFAVAAATWAWHTALAAPGIGSLLAKVASLNVGTALAAVRMGVVAVATHAWTAAQWLWNAAMTANPIGLIIVGVGALIAAGVALWQNWDTVKEKLGSAWGWMKGAFAAAVEWMGKAWESSPLGLVLGAGQKLANWAGGLFGEAAPAARAAVVGTALAVSPAAASLPPTAQQAAVTSTVNAPISVTVAPGKEREMADEIARALAEQERHAAARARASLYDVGGA